MSTTFFISDMHLGHENMAKSRGMSLDEHDARLIFNWSRVVSYQDEVFCLGDFHWHPHKFLPGKPDFRELPGRKTLVVGNHDNGDWGKYKEMGFQKVRAMREILLLQKTAICTHIPVHHKELKSSTKNRYRGRWDFNVHGHTHEHNITCEDCTESMGIEVRNDRRYINVCAEQINYTPISMEKIEENIANSYR